MSTNSSHEPDGTIPVDYAIQIAAHWRAYLASSGQAFVGKSFLIPIISFENILKRNPHAEGVRAYIGLDDPTDPTSAKLMLVPVVNGEDIIYRPHNDGDTAEEHHHHHSNVFDLTTVCPPWCPVSSPLNS